MFKVATVPTDLALVSIAVKPVSAPNTRSQPSLLCTHLFWWLPDGGAGKHHGALESSSSMGRPRTRWWPSSFRRELDEAGIRIAANTGLPPAKQASSEQGAGTYREALMLASMRGFLAGSCVPRGGLFCCGNKLFLVQQNCERLLFLGCGAMSMLMKPRDT